MQKEIQGHQPRIDDIHRRSKTQSQVDGERQSVQEERLGELQDLWDQLIAETDKRHTRLIEANRAQQFYADAAEAEAWMGEQELHMMSEEKAKVQWKIYSVQFFFHIRTIAACYINPKWVFFAL